MAVFRSVLSSKGQLVIPVELRKQLGIQPGTGISMEMQGDHLLLIPDSSLSWRNMKGWLKGKPTALDILEQDRKQDTEDE
jgi:AbrB family looped-hinge helix DNA binding protein